MYNIDERSYENKMFGFIKTWKQKCSEKQWRLYLTKCKFTINHNFIFDETKYTNGWCINETYIYPGIQNHNLILICLNKKANINSIIHTIIHEDLHAAIHCCLMKSFLFVETVIDEWMLGEQLYYKKNKLKIRKVKKCIKMV